MLHNPGAASDEPQVEPLSLFAPAHGKVRLTLTPAGQRSGVIVDVVRTGNPGNALPHQLGATSATLDRFQAGEQARLFRKLWEDGLAGYDELRGIDWR